MPLMNFARGGMIDPTLIASSRANVREPVQVEGDLYSLAPATRSAAAGCSR